MNGQSLSKNYNRTNGEKAYAEIQFPPSVDFPKFFNDFKHNSHLDLLTVYQKKIQDFMNKTLLRASLYAELQGLRVEIALAMNGEDISFENDVYTVTYSPCLKLTSNSRRDLEKAKKKY